MSTNEGRKRLPNNTLIILLRKRDMDYSVIILLWKRDMDYSDINELNLRPKTPEKDARGRRFRDTKPEGTIMKERQGAPVERYRAREHGNTPQKKGHQGAPVKRYQA
jgi:hypothetical protein